MIFLVKKSQGGYKMIAWLLTVFLLFTLTGCGGSGENKEKAKSKEITVTDLAGRTVSVKAPVERVVLAESWDLHEFAAVSGTDFAKRIVGWGNALRLYDKDTYDKFSEKYPDIKNIPEVGDYYTKDFNIEKVVSLNTDLLIFPMFQYDLVKDELPKFEQAGIPKLAGNAECHETRLLRRRDCIQGSPQGIPEASRLGFSEGCSGARIVQRFSWKLFPDLQLCRPPGVCQVVLP